MKQTLFTLATASVLAYSVQAALAQDKPKPPPAWQQGKPAAMGESKLAPLAGKMTETPASEIPIDKVRLPKGFKAEIWATGLVGARAMTLNDDQTKMWVGTRGIGRIYEVSIDADKRTHKVLVDKLTQPTSLFANGALYVFAIDKVLRYDNAAKGAAGQPVDMTKAFDLPPEQHHNWKYLGLGPDKKLYVPFGAPCNICEPPTKEYAQIRRYNLDGSGKEVIATGVRNTQGFDWHPKTGELWFTDHGRDWLGDKGPEDELNRIDKAGNFYGYPYCHAKGYVDPVIKKADPCKGVTMPVALMGPHAAVMGIKFYTGDMFPKEYQNTMFIARKGSWNREVKFGFDVVNVRPSPDGKSAKVTPFMTGFLEDPKTAKFWGRPAYIAQLKDGSLLVSDEQLGAIYRISYSAPAKKK